MKRTILAFGRQMLLNLEARGCPLRGIRGAPDLAAQRERLTSCGWERSASLDMNGGVEWFKCVQMRSNAFNGLSIIIPSV